MHLRAPVLPTRASILMSSPPHDRAWQQDLTELTEAVRHAKPGRPDSVQALAIPRRWVPEARQSRCGSTTSIRACLHGN
jgi:hypothetical protein